MSSVACQVQVGACDAYAPCIPRCFPCHGPRGSDNWSPPVRWSQLDRPPPSPASATATSLLCRVHTGKNKSRSFREGKRHLSLFWKEQEVRDRVPCAVHYLLKPRCVFPEFIHGHSSYVISYLHGRGLPTVRPRVSCFFVAVTFVRMSGILFITTSHHVVLPRGQLGSRCPRMKTSALGLHSN